MSLSEYDSYRPERPPRKKKRKSARPRPGQKRAGAADGSREELLVGEVEFESYYGRPIVKAPPWENPIAIYLFLGGVAGGSSILGAGAKISGRKKLLRSTRLTAMVALGGGTIALIEDLGRPERFYHMMRTIKISSPMSVGSWVLACYGTSAGIAFAIEADKLTKGKLPLGPFRKLLHALDGVATAGAAVFGSLLASYTGALLADTSVPTWAAAKDNLSYLFASSATMASGGTAMVFAPAKENGPARLMAVTGAAADLYFSHKLQQPMHELEAEPLNMGVAGEKLKWAERLAISGGIGAALLGGKRVFAALSGAALATASYFTRQGVLQAGLESVKDPRRVVEPQKARLAKRREQGIHDDSITTLG